MNILDRFSRLNAREQRLLNTTLLVAGVVFLVLLPLGLSGLLHSRRNDNQALSDAIDSIADSRDQIEKAKQEKLITLQRYAKPAPPLAAFLAELASDAGVEIPESQDRQAIPHGKKYSERSTKIALHRVGMLKLSKFMEHIEQAGNPIIISALDIRKHGPDPDTYDVEMTVSAFDRNGSSEKPKKASETAPEEAKP